ncbi:MAG: peptidoglycan DD-metalloendopeptidase family protein [Bacteroidota bacterium]
MNSTFLRTSNLAFRPVIRRFLISLSLLLIGGSLLGQSAADLRQKREALQAEIKENTRRLGDTRRNKEAALVQVALLQKQIRNREELISTLQQEIEQTESSIGRTNEVVLALSEDIERLKGEYADLVRAAYRARLQHSWLTFILSSKSFNEAFRRWQYLRQYQRFRSRQAKLIVATQASLASKLSQLERDREDKAILLVTEQNQQTSLGREKNAQDQLLNRLKKNEATILAEIKEQEVAKEELNQAIEKSIAAEMARIRREERASRSSGSTPSRTNTTSNASGGTFAQLKGRLPWPIDGEITKRFGRQPHPTVKGVEISNNGIDISVSGRSDVAVVADGTVVSTHFVPGYRNMVLVRHGDFYTVYSNLETVSVGSGSELSAGQSIGRISKQAGELHFEVWRQKERLNPEQWIQ